MTDRRPTRRIVLLCLLLSIVVCLLYFVPAESAVTVYFTAINEKILPLSESTMPVRYRGAMYMPLSVLDDLAHDLAPVKERGPVRAYADDTPCIHALTRKRLFREVQNNTPHVENMILSNYTIQYQMLQVKN